MTLRNAPVAAILPAKDMERAKKFYSDKLGLRFSNIVAPETVAYDAGDGTMLVLYKHEPGTKAEHTVAGWLVDDFEQTVKDLRQKGIEFEQYDQPGLKTDERGIAEVGGVQGAWFKDTEGNILAITERPD